MSTRGLIPPHDIDCEVSLLGACLLRPSIVHDLYNTLDPRDFYKPGHQWVYHGLLQLHDAGQPIDTVTVAAHLAEQQVLDAAGGIEKLVEMQNTCPSLSHWSTYADKIIDCSRRRLLIEELAEMTTSSYQRGEDIEEILKRAEMLSMNRLIAPRAADIAGLYGIVDFALHAAELDANSPWLVEHIIKPRWRTILVAGEGVGKAVLMRFIGLHAAAGRDPWNPGTFVDKQRRVLYVDTENPAEAIIHQTKIANRRSDVDLVNESEGHFFIWHREGGMDLRQRRPQAEFDAVLSQVQPEIVLAGPLYKLYRRHPKEDMEQAAQEFTEVLDDFRVRYNFGLMLEHHAPKGQGGAFRDLNPFGSSLLMRWPELGITLDFEGKVEPDDVNYTLNVGRFRRDRVVNDWPTQIERNSRFSIAWMPHWARGRGTKLTQS